VHIFVFGSSMWYTKKKVTKIFSLGQYCRRKNNRNTVNLSTPEGGMLEGKLI